MSSSKSKQSTTYNTTTNYEVNTLDGGAIESSFDFAKQQSADAFDFGAEALNTVDNTTNHAFDTVESTVDAALASNNKTLATMSDLVKTTQTQGATELINANKDTMKTMYVTIGVVIVVMFIMMLLIRGHK